MVLKKLIFKFIKIYFSYLDNPIRHQHIRDIDERTNSSLTESRHVSMQANVPTNGSLRVLPVVEGEASFERTPFSQSASEHKD